MATLLRDHAANNAPKQIRWEIWGALLLGAIVLAFCQWG